MIRKSLFCGVLFYGVTVFSQEAVLTAGGEASGNNGTVSYSIGQTSYLTEASSDGSVAQGVQQAFDISVVPIAGAADDLNESLSLEIYPNPTSNAVKILSKEKLDNCTYQLLDLHGNILVQNEFANDQNIVQMDSLEPSIYLLKIFSIEKTIKTFKIIKH